MFHRTLLLIPLTCASIAKAATCYMPEVGVDPARPDREIFVLVDQTTPAGPDLTTATLSAVGPLLVPGSAFTVATFAQARPGGYASVRARGTLESAIAGAKRKSIGIPVLDRLTACLQRQATDQRRSASGALRAAFDGSRASFDRSEIMASLRELGPMVAASPAKSRIVLVVSDMLEHSSATTFYARCTLKHIDPSGELGRAKAAKLTGSFGNACVYILGAALLPAGAQPDIASTDALADFWTRWFAASNARVVQFGRPYLMQAVGARC